MITCPRCGSKNIIKNGSIHNGTPKFMCKDCKRQFVKNPTRKVISTQASDSVDKF